jgi:hypothetical protein
MPEKVLPEPVHRAGYVPLAIFVDIRLVLEFDYPDSLVVEALRQPLTGNEW